MFKDIDTNGNNIFNICNPFSEDSNLRFKIYDLLFLAKIYKVFLSVLKKYMILYQFLYYHLKSSIQFQILNQFHLVLLFVYKLIDCCVISY